MIKIDKKILSVFTKKTPYITTGGSVGGIDIAFSCSVSPTKILSGRVASLRVVRRCTTSSCMYILQKGEGVSREDIIINIIG